MHDRKFLRVVWRGGGGCATVNDHEKSMSV